ncbi:MAG TPA: YhcH/YjgK/YiaL family protein [Dinghuibacter sp.]|uniref:YhcH/YjgK/YiaL family protein n=1 Tax=Dinghuibacter sp. TaxID=2024697 RepID=UPI002CF0C0F8|nr:YhcH/YjgK/YiaL family protein [Dinghuibacter sp.]HTJ11278.1 YhcH/YjgK/YiaL family protein [Dinghuibacter sp.]
MRLFLLIAVFSAASMGAAAQVASPAGDTAASAWTVKRARAWVAKGEWKNGLTQKPHGSVNPVDFTLQYHRNPALWNKVFTFLRTQDLEHLAPGKYPIDGDNAYAMISQGHTKPMDSVKWESHRQYIDLHYVITGKEKIGVASIGKATVTEPFTDKSDNAHYNATGIFYTAEPGVFFLFFPRDVHRPGITVPGTMEDKKLVIKIKVSQ